MQFIGDQNIVQSSYDIIIVGGGSAGCALAYRLSEDKDRSVLLLEAGRSDKHIFSRVPAASPLALASSDFNWMYRTEPDTSRNNKSDMWPAGRCLGKGSSINGMMFIRAHPWDFDHWNELGNSGWSYDDVLPYFRRMEDNERGKNDYRGLGGPQKVSESRCSIPVTETWIKAVQEAGFTRSEDLNGQHPEGVDYCQLSQENGLRHSTAHAYIWPIMKKRGNLTVQLNANVERISVTESRAKGVEVQMNGQLISVEARQGVVLSAGAIASPKLLMLSGIGDGVHLQNLGIETLNNLPGVGMNLQEHPALNLEVRLNSHTLSSDQGLFRNIKHGLNFILRRRGPLTSSIGHAQAFLKTKPDLPAPNVQIILTPLSFERKGEKIIVSKNRGMGFAIGLMRPRSRGQIRLASNSANELPVIEHALLGHHEDVKEIIDGFRLSRKIVQQNAFQSHYVNEVFPGSHINSDEDLESMARDAAFPMYHPVGTCKMGNDSMAVVNNNLQVRGMHNLWVADASIMPTLTSGNTNATAIMIGERASDLIKEQLRH